MKWFLPAAIALTLIVHVPPFLRTGLNLDALLYDLFARDALKGKLLFRDMVENRPPGMFTVMAGIRGVFGPWPEALRAVDLVLVLSALAILSRWVTAGFRTFAYFLLMLAYFAANEWQHMQADTWCLLPILGALQVRFRPPGRWAGVLEGVLWGLAVWMKPHFIVAAAAVWLAHAAWANGRGPRAALRDLGTVVLGGLFAGGVGVGLMAATGMWRPFLDHELTYVPEYTGADMYTPFTPGLFRIGYMVRNAPFDLPYLILPLLSPVLLGRAVRQDADPRRVLLLGLLAGWALQAWLLQHVHDYAHTGGVLVGIALLADYIARVPGDGPRRFYQFLVLLLAGYGVAEQTVLRAANWPRVWAGPSAQLRDDLAKFPQVRWTGIEALTAHLRRAGAADGEVVALSDSAFPVLNELGTAPAGRFYMLHNNLLGFRSRRNEIWAEVRRHPVRFVVCDIRAIRRSYPLTHKDETPLPADWFGPRRWADRVQLRAGPYILAAVTADDLPQFLADVTDYGPDP